VEYTWNYLLKRGAKPEKTVLGVPLYGRAFTLENPHDNEMGAR
jgi:GH18 family chitinase